MKSILICSEEFERLKRLEKEQNEKNKGKWQCSMCKSYSEEKFRLCQVCTSKRVYQETMFGNWGSSFFDRNTYTTKSSHFPADASPPYHNSILKEGVKVDLRIGHEAESKSSLNCGGGSPSVGCGVAASHKTETTRSNVEGSHSAIFGGKGLEPTKKHGSDSSRSYEAIKEPTKGREIGGSESSKETTLTKGTGVGRSEFSKESTSAKGNVVGGPDLSRSRRGRSESPRTSSRDNERVTHISTGMRESELSKLNSRHGSPVTKVQNPVTASSTSTASSNPAWCNYNYSWYGSSESSQEKNLVSKGSLNVSAAINAPPSLAIPQKSYCQYCFDRDRLPGKRYCHICDKKWKPPGW